MGQFVCRLELMRNICRDYYRLSLSQLSIFHTLEASSVIAEAVNKDNSRCLLETFCGSLSIHADWRIAYAHVEKSQLDSANEYNSTHMSTDVQLTKQRLDAEYDHICHRESPGEQHHGEMSRKSASVAFYSDMRTSQI